MIERLLNTSCIESGVLGVRVESSASPHSALSFFRGNFNRLGNRKSFLGHIPVERFVDEPHFSGDLAKSENVATKVIGHISRAVIRLSESVCPHAILWAIIGASILPFQRHPLGSPPHVCQEGLKGVTPSIAHLYSFCPVAIKSGVGWLVASVPGILPCSVLRGSGKPMLHHLLSSDLADRASATLIVASRFDPRRSPREDSSASANALKNGASSLHFKESNNLNSASFESSYIGHRSRHRQMLPLDREESIT